MNSESLQSITDSTNEHEGNWSNVTPLLNITPDVPKFDENLLPESLLPWVSDIAERMQCPPDFLAAGAIVSLAGAVGNKVTVKPKQQDDWVVVPNIWGGVIGRPGIMKSPALDEIMKPLKLFENKSIQDYQIALDDFEDNKRIQKAVQTEIDKEIREAIKNRKNPKNVLRENELGDPPYRTRYIVKDATIEALTEILSNNPSGTMIYRDELMGLLATLDKEGREDSRAFYLESWNGNGSFTSDRIGRGHIHIPTVCISILGGIQPGKLEPYVRQSIQGGFGDDGLLQRFQVLVWPDHPEKWKNIDRYPDDKAKQNAHHVYEQLIRLVPEENSRRFTAEAQELFDEWRSQLENRIRSGDLHPALESHFSKYRKLMPSIALLLYLADNGDGDIPVSYAEKAWAWCEYLEGHAFRVYNSAINSSANAAHLITKRLKKLTNKFTCRDVYRPQWAGLKDRNTVQAGIDYLVDENWLVPIFESTGGKVKTAYLVNPKTREMMT